MNWKETDDYLLVRDYLVGCIHGATVPYGDLSGYDKSTVDYQAEELLNELFKQGFKKEGG